ncbi:HET-domain-containing protein, partial [Polyplosphaeria fusca]
MRRWSTSTVASKISLQISNVPLAQSEAFSALSYAWGTSEQDQEIALNGSSLSISQTLLDALVQLESEEDSKKKLFWIDAICINQYDYEEKSEQVQIMGDIYRQAADVIIWLGTRNYEQQNTFTNVKSKLDNYLSDCDFDSVAEAIDALTNRPWWRRLWILQELVLSRQAFLRCGPLAITWDSFEYFLDISDLFVACNLTHETATIVRLIRQETRILSRCWRKGKKGQKLSLFNLLVNIMAFGVRETSDPRDRVYALLGLAKDIEQLGIRPDYSLFREQVYMNTAEALISK